MCMKLWICRPCSHGFLHDVEYCTQAVRPSTCGRTYSIPIHRTDYCQVIGCRYLGEKPAEQGDAPPTGIKEIEQVSPKTRTETSEMVSEDERSEARRSFRGTPPPGLSYTTADPKDRELEHSRLAKDNREAAEVKKPKPESTRKDSPTSIPTGPRRARGAKRWETLQGWR